MPFQFPLQDVLHFRQSIEHQQELRLRAANQQVARVQHLIEEADAQRQNLYANRSQELSQGVSAAELQFGLLYEKDLLRQRKELEPQLAQSQQLRDQQREIFRRARQARETLESVRDRQLELYKKDAARREQRSLDDLFLLRREYLRRG
ncbi:MAG: flagellar export protein FliJ [Candidatus Sulfotelmatobacter sp.]|jgi:flagellar export protein FliJ